MLKNFVTKHWPMLLSQCVATHNCAVEFFRYASKFTNTLKSVLNRSIFIILVLYTTLRCAAKPFTVKYGFADSSKMLITSVIDRWPPMCWDVSHCCFRQNPSFDVTHRDRTRESIPFGLWEIEDVTSFSRAKTFRIYLVVSRFHSYLGFSSFFFLRRTPIVSLKLKL